MQPTPGHPIELIGFVSEAAALLIPSPHHFEFSKYVYVPQAVEEERHVYRVSLEELVPAFTREAGNLKPIEEIAFHSRVVFQDGRTAHVPMIDMGCAGIDPYLPMLKKAFEDFGVPRFSVFHSGRSFHVYGHGLLAGDPELIRFMGRILLLNLPNRERVIDERWVGHRLMAGYSTLRWTKNNPHYQSAPVFYGVF